MNLNTLFAALVLLATAGLSVHAQHGHLNAGARGTNQGDALYFANGDIFAESSGYVKELVYAESGPYAGYYEGGISLTALPQTVANGGPTANAPALGSFIQVRLESVAGPAGGTFGFWDADAPSPTWSISVNNPVPSALIPLSDASLGAGQPGADPFGHLHGRRFTTDVLGDYVIGFKLFDTSANGAGGGPIHDPSDTFLLSFRAVPEPGSLVLMLAGGALLLFSKQRRR